MENIQKDHSCHLKYVVASVSDPLPILPELQLHRGRRALRRAATCRGRAAGQPPPEGDQQGHPRAAEGEILRDTLRFQEMSSTRKWTMKLQNQLKT